MTETITPLVLFRWDPSLRMTPNEAMEHEWIVEGRFQKTRGQSRHVKKVLAASNTATSQDNNDDKAHLAIRTGIPPKHYVLNCFIKKRNRRSLII